MLSYLYPQTVEEVNSKINGLIRVSKSKGKYSLWVNGFEQSGPVYVAKIWKAALARVTSKPKSVLILGLGGGTLVSLLSEKWPQASITGVEIDPIMISLGKKYFGLGKYKNLKIVLADARTYRPARQFDLVLVDCYLGGKKIFPKTKGKQILFNNLNRESLKNEVTLS